MPGARKWTGGVFVRNEFQDSDGFPDEVERWTMDVAKNRNGIINAITSHDYLGSAKIPVFVFVSIIITILNLDEFMII